MAMQRPTISTDVLNKKGGSLSLGHPCAASGARMVLGTARQVQRGRRVLLGICAAGGLGAADVLEGVWDRRGVQPVERQFFERYLPQVRAASSSGS